MESTEDDEVKHVNNNNINNNNNKEIYDINDKTKKILTVINMEEDEDSDMAQTNTANVNNEISNTEKDEDNTTNNISKAMSDIDLTTPNNDNNMNNNEDVVNNATMNNNITNTKNNKSNKTAIKAPAPLSPKRVIHLPKDMEMDEEEAINISSTATTISTTTTTNNNNNNNNVEMLENNDEKVDKDIDELTTTTTIDTKNANNNTTIDHNKININIKNTKNNALLPKRVLRLPSEDDDDSDVRLVQSDNNHKMIDGIEILTNKTSSITTNNSIEEEEKNGNEVDPDVTIITTNTISNNIKNNLTINSTPLPKPNLDNLVNKKQQNDIIKQDTTTTSNKINTSNDKIQGITIFEQKRRQRKRLRLQKWRRMMSQWEHFEQKYPGKIRQRIRKGIPNILRGHMWMSLTGAGVAKYHNANIYKECLYAPNSGLEETISRDISRTFPKHQQFRVTGGLGQRSLFQVLRAYSVYNPAIGYCQGMGYICALLLCYLNEEDAFWTMVSVMQKHQMEGLYQEGLPKLQLYHIVLEKLMRLHLPQIASHLFDNLSMLPSMFASKWLLTIFTYSFPLDVVVRVWDIFMSEGWTIVFKVSLALVNLLRNDIMRENNFENVLRMLEEYPLSVPGRTIISAALQIPLSTIDLQTIEQETIKETGGTG